jgi:hypothetical protein
MDCSKYVSLLDAIIQHDREFDYPPHCYICNRFIGGFLTDYGEQELIREYQCGRNRKRINEYLNHYDWIDRYFIWTFIGMTDPDGNLKD